jgi:hypothetical protein
MTNPCAAAVLKSLRKNSQLGRSGGVGFQTHEEQFILQRPGLLALVRIEPSGISVTKAVLSRQAVGLSAGGDR